MSELCAKVLPAVVAEVKEVLTAVPACHDWDHTLRVLHNARHLARLTAGVDADVVALAAVLHDIARPEELADSGRTCHAERGAVKAVELLTRLGVTDAEELERVAHCIRAHRYRRRGGERPSSAEAKVVFDADKLDSIGAVGIGRAFHFAGRTGARLHNTEEEATRSSSYSREDTAYREYLVKLRHVHQHLLTAEGRRIAAHRHAFMVTFFERLCLEVRGEDL